MRSYCGRRCQLRESGEGFNELLRALVYFVSGGNLELCSRHQSDAHPLPLKRSGNMSICRKGPSVENCAYLLQVFEPRARFTSISKFPFALCIVSLAADCNSDSFRNLPPGSFGTWTTIPLVPSMSFLPTTLRAVPTVKHHPSIDLTPRDGVQPTKTSNCPASVSLINHAPRKETGHTRLIFPDTEAPEPDWSS